MPDQHRVSDKVANPKLHVLHSQLTEALSAFETKRLRNKNTAFRTYLGATVLSAIVTVVLGFQGVPIDKVPYVQNAALILSSIVTMLMGFETFFNHRALWVRYTQTVSQLLSIRAKIQYLEANGSFGTQDVELDKLFDELQLTLTQTNNWWQSQRSESLGRKVTLGQDTAEVPNVLK
jgi:uncharacterized membrane protein SirB2